MKDVLLQIVAGVILLAIGAIFPGTLAYFSLSKSISANYNWMEIPTRIGERKIGAKEQSIKNLSFFIGEASATNLVNKLEYESELRIISAEIRNETDEQSKMVRVYSGKIIVAYLAKSKRYGDELSSIPVEQGEYVSLGVMNPGAKYRLIIVSNEIISEPDFLVLSDTKKAYIKSDRLGSDIFGITSFVNNYPELSYFVALISSFVFLGLIAFIPFAIYFHNNIDFAAKRTTSADLVRLTKIIGRAKSLYPEKAAAIELAEKNVDT